MFGRIIYLVAFLCIIHIGDAAKKKGTFPLWENLKIRKEARKEQYLFDLPEQKGKEIDYSVEFIKDIYDIIHARQNPTKEDCKKRRFSVIQMSATSFEGTGSLLKQVMISTAIAMHSNRTLIWGLGLPFPFEVTKELWAGPGNDEIVINNEHLNCSQYDITFGPLGCFFLPVSTCTLEDAGPGEVIEFSHNPYNDSARLTMAEMRKGISMYHPPMGLLDYIWSKGKYPESAKAQLIENQAHLWSAAVAAYVFRLKTHLVRSFEKKFAPIIGDTSSNSLWGVHIRHGDLKALANIYAYKEIFDFDDYFEAMIQFTHKQKETPDKFFIATDSLEADNIEHIFKKYLRSRKTAKTCKAGQKNCQATSSSSSNKKNKKHDEDEFVQEVLRESQESDDYGYSGEEDDIYDEIEEEEEEEDEDDEEEDEEEEEEEDEDLENYLEDEDEEDEPSPKKSSSSSSASKASKKKEMSKISADDDVWYNHKKPKFQTVFNKDRYRTEHGSHTVAANGGCFRDENYQQRGMRCALNYEAIIHYQTIEEHRSIPRPQRMLRVYLESIEDLYILSRCSALIGQGSSHYSTLASLLIVAGHGTKNVQQRLMYLDAKSIASGMTPTAFLHGMNMLNGTNAIDSTKLKSGAGAQRWIIHTNHFISGLPGHEYPKVKLSFDPWSKDYRFHMKNGLPHINDQLFYLEARSWLGNSKTNSKPTLPGHCYSLPQGNQNFVAFLAEIINLGVEHLQSSHNSQAMQCWSDALKILSSTATAVTSDLSSIPLDQVENMKSVASGNMQTMRIYRYSEMIVNELKTIRDYYIFTDKYMKQAYDRGIDESTRAASKNRPMSLEEVNEKILNLEKEMETLKKLRERLIYAHEIYAQNNYNLDQANAEKMLPRL